MKEYYDVMRNILNLSETSMDGLHHIASRLEEGHFESTVILMEDVVEAVYHIESSVLHFADKLEPNGLDSATANLRLALNSVVHAYEQGQRAKALVFMQQNLLPAFARWREELNVCLSPYVAC